MADEDKSIEQQNATQTPPVPTESSLDHPPAPADSPSPAPGPTDRSELLHRARAFLVSPQVRHEDVSAKRRFLADKGLTDTEIDGLLYEVPPPAPSVPPRTYPQPPPSNVPYMLSNVFRAFTWIAGGSAALLLVYFRFLYPKIAQTYQARLSLRSHRSTLLERLTRSLEELKATQHSTFAVLPQPEPHQEPAKFAGCHGLDQLAAASEGAQDISPLSLLRCAIEDCSKDGRSATSAELFRTLEAKFPWIAEEGAQHEDNLWQTLTTIPLFQSSISPSPSTSPASPSLPPPSSPEIVWAYTPAASTPTPPLLTSLAALKSALPPPAPPNTAPQQPKYQHTFQALSDLTGYIATQTYGLPPSFRAPGVGLGPPLSPEEEEVRREIRALKGLVLNRRTFMPRASRPESASGLSGAVSDGAIASTAGA